MTRPSVTLKLATSLDGRIATASGESQWITGPEARLQGHHLRATHDAILVGVETVLADNPRLNVRIPSPSGGGGGAHCDPTTGGSRSETDEGEVSPSPPSKHQPISPDPLIRAAPPPTFSPEGRRDPVRIILDTHLRTPATAHVAISHSLIFTTSTPTPIGQAEVIQIAPDASGRPSIPAVLDALSQRGITSLLIEGGGRVAAAFIQAGAVDRIEWFRASILLGGEGRPGIAALDLANLASAPKFVRQTVTSLGDDLWESYVKA